MAQEIHFRIASLLEGERRSTSDLERKLADEGMEYDTRTIQRKIKDLRDLDFPIQSVSKDYYLPEAEVYLPAVVDLFKGCVADVASWRSRVYGDIDRKEISDLLAALEGVDKPADFLYRLVTATVESRQLKFFYRPETQETVEKLKSKSFPIDTPPGTMPVTMLPHYLVFSGQHFLLLGEAYFREEPVQRQYSVRGILRLQIGEAAPRQLSINPRDLYADSVQVWVGGEKHDLVIEELDIATQQARREYTRTVNGEEEILSLVARSLGRMRIVDPPAALVEKARGIGLPVELMFKFSE